MNNQFQPVDQFDSIIRSRLFAEDFGQPQIKDANWYKSRATNQIKDAIQAILNATNQHDFTIAIAQASAFIDAALSYEFIDISEKSKWLGEMAVAVRTQMIAESA